jgi:hypothetical protein
MSKQESEFRPVSAKLRVRMTEKGEVSKARRCEIADDPNALF